MSTPTQAKQEPQIILCPYCGHVQTVPENAAVPDQCDECKGLFEPLSRRATQISMGPWYIRDKKNPFRPGCSFEVISRMAKNNRIKPTTVLRGPSTKQFWSVARNVPGIAHLLGYCHGCGAKADPNAPACTACNAKFEEPKERNELGLAYRTAQEAAAAQRALEREIAAITGAPVSPGGSGITAAINPAPGASLLDEVLGSGGNGKFGGSPLLNFSSEPATAVAAAPAPAPTSFAPSAPQRTAPVAPAAHSIAPVGGTFAAGFRPAAATATPAAARAVDAFSIGGEADDTGVDSLERKQRSASAMTWGLIGFNALLILIVVAFVVLNRGKPTDSGTPSKDSNANKDSSTNNSSNNNTQKKPAPNVVKPDGDGEATTVKPRPPVENVDPVTPKTPETTPENPALAQQQADMRKKLVEARALVDGGDFASALPILIDVRDSYPKAWHPPDLAKSIDDVTLAMLEKSKSADDKKSVEEVTTLVNTAKAMHVKNDYKGELNILNHIRESYAAKYHPKDLAKHITVIERAIERKEKATFFGTPID